MTTLYITSGWWRATVVASVALAVLLGSCQNGKEQNAASQDPKKSLQDTLKRLTELIELTPINARLYRERAMIYHQMGDTGSAISDLNECLELNPKDPESWYLRGFIRYSAANDKAALADFLEAERQKSTNPEAYYQAGTIYLLQGQLKPALAKTEQAIALDSAAMYFFTKGLILREMNRPRDAELAWQTGLTRDTTHIKTLAALFDLYMDHYHNPRQAVVYNYRILEADSTHPLAHANMGYYFIKEYEAYKAVGKKDSATSSLYLAITEYSRALTGQPGYVAALYQRGWCYHQLGAKSWGQALTDLEKVLEIQPGNAQASFLAASIYEANSDAATAARLYQQALTYNPGWADAQKGLARTAKAAPAPGR